MIIARLEGGLGNQMFQYAVSRAIAHKRQTRVKLNLRPVKRDFNRSFALGNWNVAAAVATSAEIIAMRIADKFVQALRPATLYYRRPVVQEQGSGFDANVLQAPRHCMLVGYWQSEKYFKDIESGLRREFTLRAGISAESEKVASQIRSSDSVFLHIRRGDYISDAAISKVYDICSMEYYQAAVEYVKQRILQPHFFVFSDEPAWARENLKLPAPITIIDHNPPGDGNTPRREHEDLWLMSLCQHAIVANSSFSWWGAWLNPNKDRVVIAPKKWLRTHDEPDRVPGRWIRI